MLRFQEKNYSQGRFRLEMDTYSRYNLTQNGTKLLMENYKKAQVDQDDVESGRIEFSNMEATALFKLWDKIMMTYVISEATEKPVVVKTYQLLPSDVYMYNGDKEAHLLTVDQCVLVEVETALPNKRLRFTRVKNIKNGDDVVRRQTGVVELSTPDGIVRFDKYVNVVRSMRECLYSTPKNLFETGAYKPRL
jgi:hypothetical protein